MWWNINNYSFRIFAFLYKFVNKIRIIMYENDKQPHEDQERVSFIVVRQNLVSGKQKIQKIIEI